MSVPQRWNVPDGTGQNIPALTGSQTTLLQGKFRHRLCYSTLPFVLGLAGVRVNAGQTTPWVTDQLQYDLASATIDFAWTYSDASVKRQRYLGVKAVGVTITSDGKGNDPHVYAELDLVASVCQGNAFDASVDPTAVAFPAPTLAQLPSDYIFHQDAKGAVSIGGTPRTLFDNLHVEIKSVVKPYFDESRFANRIRCHGRHCTWSMRSLLRPTPTDRATWESTGSLGATQIAFVNGSHNLTLDFYATNYLDSVQEDFVLDDEAYYVIGGTSYLDATGGADLLVTYA
ncbi:MAG: hypothetical protein KGM43_06350 [Planctomycetota bacterium]|nr:hypothetical protein [Planctomycetota bacterium]